MEVRTLLKRGTDHLVNCEDDLFTFNDGTTYIGAVFDGCSTGIKSHFASTLYEKILKKYLLKKDRLFTLDEIPLRVTGQIIVDEVYSQLNLISSVLKLDPLEILSTMILVIVRDNQAHVIVSGDGCIYLNDGVSAEETKIESPENAPDYLAYHLKDLQEAHASLKEYSFEVGKTISICSDGIYSFTDKNKKDVSNIVIPCLLYDESLLKSEAMLSRKYNLLLKEGYSNYDDISIVRFIKQ